MKVEQEIIDGQAGGLMGDRGDDGQRSREVRPKGRALEVTRVWEVRDTPWYVRYAYDWFLLLVATPILFARSLVPDGGGMAFILEVLLIGIFFMWLVSLPPEKHE